MKILQAIFGSSKNTETIVDGAVSGIDKLFFTKEEQADVRMKTGEWFLRYLEATQPQNLSRRLIAIVVVGIWAALLLVAVAAWNWNATYSEFVFRVIDENVNTPFAIIIGFYFAAHVVRSWQSNKDA